MPPDFNRVFYESTDLVNCINWPTYTAVKSWVPERTNWVPHALPKGLYFQMTPEQRASIRAQALPGKPQDEFVGLWVNRNAHRKRPGDVLMSWRLFIDALKEKHGHTKATLVMHTDPHDHEGPNLIKIVEHLKLFENVTFSVNRVSFPDMNAFYNMCDFTVNISSAVFTSFSIGTRRRWKFISACWRTTRSRPPPKAPNTAPRRAWSGCGVGAKRLWNIKNIWKSIRRAVFPIRSTTIFKS
jgi:hypothetical protein